MKRLFAKIAAYAVVVILLLLATKCDHGVKITTPQRDAKRIAELAELVESEADLRAVEKLATKYELAYRKSINGAAAMKFKRLAEPALIAAGDRRDAFRETEDYLLAQQTQLNDKLSLLDAAWRLEGVLAFTAFDGALFQVSGDDFVARSAQTLENFGT